MDEQKEPQEDFSFLQETIKEDKFIAKKMRKYFWMIIMLGVIFGIASSVTFVVVKPWMESMFKEEEVVTFPKDDEYVLPDDVKEEVKEEVKAEIKDEIKAETEAEAQAQSKPADDKLDSLDVQQIYAQLYELSQKAAKSVVTVQNVIPKSEDEKVTVEQIIEDPGVTGLVVAQTELEVLILASTMTLEQDQEIAVKFASGNTYEANVKMEDKNLGYAILSIPKLDVILEDIVVAKLGNSNIVSQGDVVIAIGNQFQHEKGIGYGVVSATSNTLNYVDGIYELISTDIPIVANGTGVLTNTGGEVIGMINASLTADTIVQAIGISRLKAIIELLSNGNEIPYLGITCVVVTQEIAASNSGMPTGLYVQAVEANSPAMVAGFKVGDIITRMNGYNIYSSASFQNKLLSSAKDDTIEVQIQRIGQEGYVEVELAAICGTAK